jgi:hypothetical protein
MLSPHTTTPTIVTRFKVSLNDTQKLKTDAEVMDYQQHENNLEEDEEEVNKNEFENDEDQTIKILSIYVTEKRLGVAFYDELTNSLKADGYDIASVDMEGILSALKFSCDPTIILIQPRVVTNKPLLDIVTSAWDGTPEVYTFHTMKNSYWNYENSIRLMCSKLIVKQESTRNQSIESLSYQVNLVSLTRL